VGRRGRAMHGGLRVSLVYACVCEALANLTRAIARY
jgi:hypothetical protein